MLCQLNRNSTFKFVQPKLRFEIYIFYLFFNSTRSNKKVYKGLIYNTNLFKHIKIYMPNGNFFSNIEFKDEAAIINVTSQQPRMS